MKCLREPYRIVFDSLTPGSLHVGVPQIRRRRKNQKRTKREPWACGCSLSCPTTLPTNRVPCGWRYGSYGMSLPIDYQPSHACMLERGWVLAFAHVRGGGERGKAWHAAGRGLNKWNSFWDFQVCCAVVFLPWCVVLCLDGVRCAVLVRAACGPATSREKRPRLKTLSTSLTMQLTLLLGKPPFGSKPRFGSYCRFYRARVVRKGHGFVHSPPRTHRKWPLDTTRTLSLQG